MRFLENERATLDKFLPGLDAELAAHTLRALEQPGSPGLAAFKAADGPGLLIPEIYGGQGATPLDGIRIQRAIGSRSPSVAVATTMHHFSVASLVEASSTALEGFLIEAIATQRLLLASGFAEGRTGAAILTPTLRAVRRGTELVVSGTKKPCTLSRSMDLLTASVMITDEDGSEHLGVAVIPADSPGVEIRPFWGSFVLAGAESDEVVLTEVVLPESLVVETETGNDGGLDDVQTSGFLWFELLVSASYLGVASALVEKVLAADKADAAAQTELIVEAEAAMSTLEGVAYAMVAGARGEEMFAKALFARYSVQDSISRIRNRAVELLGGMAFINGDDVGYLAAASMALAFHPPARSRMSEQLRDYTAGQPLRVA